ncbi:MAG: Glycosyl transferase family 2, partial [Microgenomates group bacterium GW2011_GWC1_33_28]
MKISGHTLFKNEEKWLWFAVSSVINYVDKLLLWDTGSTDNSWKIAQELKELYPDKISLRQYGEVTTETFSKARQEMLDETDSEWFLVVDGDEIWWEESIAKVTASIKKGLANKSESVVVPTINLIGDIFHFQEKEAGRYRFGKLFGHYNLRAVKKDIPGLHSEGVHGIWGWADENNNQIQNRNTFNFIETPYLHTTFLPRGESREADLKVPKRGKKLKYELGETLPLDYYF